MAEKREIDWEGIERDYRAGILSVREIAAAYGCSHVAIGKRAKTRGWVRDLSAKIQAKAEELVTKAEVTGSVTKTEQLATEREIIEANAHRIAEIRSAHRTDIRTARTLAMNLLAELEHQTGNQDLYQHLAELLIDPEEDSSEAAKKRARDSMEAFQRAMSLGGRTKTMKDLADTLKTLVALEREAYGIDKSAPDEDGDQGKAIPDKNLARRFALAMHLGMRAAAKDSSKPPTGA